MMSRLALVFFSFISHFHLYGLEGNAGECVYGTLIEDCGKCGTIWNGKQYFEVLQGKK